MMRLFSGLLASALLSGAMLFPAVLSAHQTSNLADPAIATMSSTSSGASFGDALNDYRSSVARRSLVVDAELTAAAQAYAQEIAATGHFSHQALDGSNSGVRARRTGCSWSHVGENLAWGHTTVTEVMTAWDQSDGHRANLQAARYNRYGVARVGTVWVLMFADRC